MIKPLDKCGLNIAESFEALQAYKVALDIESGAYLTRSFGRCRGGQTRFLFHRQEQKNKPIMARDLTEAIEKANDLLALSLSNSK